MDDSMGIRLCFAIIAISILASCDESTIDCYCGPENQPPVVWLSGGPTEGSTNPSSVRFFWGGWDPDGEVTFYEYLITDNTTGVFHPDDTTGVAWDPVYSNDSTFVFSADSLAENATDQTPIFKRSHTFFIRAVDNQGLRSRESPHRTFLVEHPMAIVMGRAPVRRD